ncbi:unnamed protein product, partial [Timema podura]|nr:unnamed protein product [Timema podura]
SEVVIGNTYWRSSLIFVWTEDDRMCQLPHSWIVSTKQQVNGMCHYDTSLIRLLYIVVLNCCNGASYRA